MTQQPGGSGPDLIGEFQRWLIRSSARGMGRQVSGQIRAALGRNQQPTGDVWETATTEPPEEAPECAWCPLCRAARLLRETKPGRDTRVTAVSDVTVKEEMGLLVGIENDDIDDGPRIDFPLRIDFRRRPRLAHVLPPHLGTG